MKNNICRIYGLNHGIINLVKNELSKNNKNTSDVYNKAKSVYPSEDFNIIDIGDLIYHLVK